MKYWDIIADNLSKAARFSEACGFLVVVETHEHAAISKSGDAYT
jgi:hypothetical protein